MSRSDHIAGLSVDKMMPADVETFFRTLHRRVPSRTRAEDAHVLDALRARLKAAAVDAGVPGANDLDPSDTHATLDAIVGHLSQLKRRHWRGDVDGERLLDRLRATVGEISADLHELSGG